MLVEIYELGYEEWFIHLVKTMVEINENSRPDFIQLKNLILKNNIVKKDHNPFLSTGKVKQSLLEFVNNNNQEQDPSKENCFSKFMNETVNMNTEHKKERIQSSSDINSSCSTIHYPSIKQKV